ncbi:hypothetical protein PLUA15_420003 [Pseudomonas lundensis]|uniref:Uncharacterized protein n=1 Tax=Pseudomonas lundensis TaxID=86185 RepID=A0AAX2HA73_9PSED|nr:hypothetical protein PLUA15_420003 [Pseudomonas lundensis]
MVIEANDKHSMYHAWSILSCYRQASSYAIFSPSDIDDKYLSIAKKSQLLGISKKSEALCEGVYIPLTLSMNPTIFTFVLSELFSAKKLSTAM